MRTAVLLATFLLLPGSAAAAPRVRVTPELAVGGAWASDLFVGAGFGPHGELLLVPGLGADLSLGPVLKLGCAYHLTYARYGTSTSGLLHDADASVRVRPTHALELELTGSGSQLRTSDPVASEPGQLPATTSTALQAGPMLKLRPTRELLLSVGYTFLSRESETGTALVPETAHTARTGATLRLGQRVEASLSYDHVASDASPAELSYVGDGATAGVALAPLGELVLRPQVALHVNRFDGAAPRTDRYLQLSVGARLPLLDELDLEAAWSFADNASDDPLSVGSRQLVYLGVRAALPWEP